MVNDAGMTWDAPVIVAKCRAASIAAILGGAIVAFMAIIITAMLAASRGSISNLTVGIVGLFVLLYILGVALFAIPAILKVLSLNLKHLQYTLTDDDLVVAERLLRPWSRQVPRQQVVPLRQITVVRQRQDFWDRLFGCGSIQLETAYDGAFEIGPIADSQRFIEGLLHQMLVNEEYLGYGEV